ncbi:uncharacterized protein LOC143459738 [Clavelina lepadiformis]|uniref:uncharacterized protein LOC143459738 n=1 Tax=Clavelina lepadiformis TaxID=159417 RepID=UPI004042DCE0
MNNQAKQSIGYTLKWVGIGLFIASQVNKAWVVLPSLLLQVGIYEQCYTNETGGCSYLSWNPINPIAPFVARVASYVVSVFLIVGIVVGFVNCCKSGKTKRNLLKVEGALDTFAGVLALATMIAFTIITSYHTLFNYSNAAWHYGWCFYMYWICGIFFCAAGVMELAAGTMLNMSYTSAQSQWQLHERPQTLPKANENGGYDNIIIASRSMSTAGSPPYSIPRANLNT